MRLLTALSLLVLFSITGVAEAASPRRPGARKAKPKTPAARSRTRSVTKAEALAFGKAVETGMSEGDASALDSRMNTDRFVQLIFQGTSIPADFRRGFTVGMKRTLKGAGSLGNQISGAMTSAGSYRVLKTYKKGTGYRIIFRLAGNGLNYHDFDLMKTAEGSVRWADVYIYMSGETLSETMRQFALSAAASQPNMIEKLMGRESAFIKDLPILQRINNSVSAGKFDEALRLYPRLSVTTRKKKAIKLIRIRAACELQGPQYEKRLAAALADFQTAFPNDPALTLLQIDLYLIQKNYRAALKAIDSLDAAVVHDPYLDITRGAVWLLAGQPMKAKALVHKAIKAIPDLSGPYMTLLDIALAQKDYAETTRLMEQLRTQFGLIFTEADMKQADVFAGFLKSKEGKAWIKASKLQASPTGGPATPK